MVERMRSRDYTPGEHVPGWDRGGADPDAELRAAGAESHYFRIRRHRRRQRRRSSTDAPARQPSRPPPGGWSTPTARPRPGSTIPSIQFETLSHRYVVGLAADTDRRGDVDCIDRITNATLYEHRARRRRADDDHDPAPVPGRCCSPRRARSVCTPLRGQSRSTAGAAAPSLPDGRWLPALDEGDDLITIVPAAPIERLRRLRRRGTQRRLGRVTGRLRIGSQPQAGERAPEPFERAVAEAVEPGLRPEQHQRPHRRPRQPQLDPAERGRKGRGRSRRRAWSSGSRCRDNW